MRNLILLLMLLGSCREKPNETGVVETGEGETTETGATETGTTETGTTETAEPVLDVDEDGYLADVDCDDENDAVHPGATEVCDEIDNDCDGEVDEETTHEFWVDGDGDGYGDESQPAVQGCSVPVGYTAYGGDCNDADPAFHPGAAETDCTDPADYNCDGSIGYADADADGFAACEDCNDDEAGVNEDAVESCNGVDDDCDGSIDEEASDMATWYGDSDGDGYGGTQFQSQSCTQPTGYVSSADDCNDLDATSHPGGAEVCDGSDNDCDTAVDEGVELTFYADVDSDGYGDAAVTVDACSPPPGYVVNGNDCDDDDPSSHPGGVEVCDAADNDCDGSADNDAVNANSWYLDGDGDGYGGSGSVVLSCDPVSGRVADGTDCNDLDSGVNPGAAELCNSVDDDCDSVVDDSPADAQAWYVDGDGDGYGAGGVVAVACTGPTGAVADNTDCDDSTSGRSPDLSEVCDSADVDEDCDGLADDDDPEGASGGSTWYVDVDQDSYGDVNDPGTEYCDPPATTVSEATDCNDGEAAINPGVAEVCDASETDEDCSGAADDADANATGQTTWYTDADSDGYGADSDAGVALCNAPSGTVTVQGDCNDGDASAYPDSSGSCATGASCAAILSSGAGTSSGVYTVDPDGSSGSASSYDVYCDQSMSGGGWTLLLSANGPSTYWGNNSANWMAPGSDAPPTSLQDADYHGLPYGELVTSEITICFQDNAHCYSFTHNQGRTLQSFFTDGVSHVEVSSNSAGISDSGSSSSRDAYLNALGVSSHSINCYWLGINETRSISSIGLVGDWNGGCGSGGSHHDDLAIGVGLQSCYDQNSCSNGGSGHAAGRTRGLNGTDDSGVHGPWFVLGR